MVEVIRGLDSREEIRLHEGWHGSQERKFFTEGLRNRGTMSNGHRGEEG
jgi:hypothetical protein